MDELTRYVIYHYGRLMTPTENMAYGSFLGTRQPPHVQSVGSRNEIMEHFEEREAEAQRLLRDGVGEFLVNVRDRIIRDHADEVILNYCPQCGALARSPRARQCPKCFHDWHELVSR